MGLQRRKGFTLIELLVVIAIIGILSAVVISSLSGARGQGTEKATLVNLNTIRNQAEIYLNTTGAGKYYVTPIGSEAQNCEAFTSYPLVFSDPKVLQALNAERELAGGSWDDVVCALSWGGASYAVAVRSNNLSTTWYCLDSQTNIKTLTGVSGIPNLGGGGSQSRCP
jgi:prepilin-type N-terminal cleavage/methylation domain-containing protein